MSLTRVSAVFTILRTDNVDQLCKLSSTVVNKLEEPELLVIYKQAIELSASHCLGFLLKQHPKSVVPNLLCLWAKSCNNDDVYMDGLRRTLRVLLRAGVTMDSYLRKNIINIMSENPLNAIVSTRSHDMYLTLIDKGAYADDCVFENVREYYVARKYAIQEIQEVMMVLTRYMQMNYVPRDMKSKIFKLLGGKYAWKHWYCRRKADEWNRQQGLLLEQQVQKDEQPNQQPNQ